MTSLLPLLSLLPTLCEALLCASLVTSMVAKRAEMINLLATGTFSRGHRAPATTWRCTLQWENVIQDTMTMSSAFRNVRPCAKIVSKLLVRTSSLEEPSKTKVRSDGLSVLPLVPLKKRHKFSAKLPVTPNVGWKTRKKESATSTRKASAKGSWRRAQTS